MSEEKKWFRFDGQVPMRIKVPGGMKTFMPGDSYPLDPGELPSKKFTEVEAPPSGSAPENAKKPTRASRKTGGK